ncbi:hypothetical protein G4N54_002582, partial [Staphylococcus pseudintermedius]|nr:hypothetical protein [Staphylococcus pseudintermedius]
MLNSNQRIIAQKGAFLNFDKVSLFTFNSDIKRILMIRISLEHNFEDLEDLMAKRKELDKDKNEGGLFNNNNIEIYREWWEINLEIDKKKRYFNDSYLDSIKNSIQKKLSEYHYRESELFPDLFKYITYRQKDYISTSNQNQRNNTES